MPRKPREEEAGAVHHVFARGNDRREIALDDLDRQRYLTLLAQVVGRTGWRVLAYCLMPNHTHLIVETPQTNLGAGMQRLHGDYARLFNRRHGRVGHLFQGRFGAVRVTTDAQLWTTAAYVAANPVDAGLCRAPEDWRWSSHNATLAGAAPPWLDVARLLDRFSGLGGDPRGRYAGHVRDRAARDAPAGVRPPRRAGTRPP